MRDLVELVVWAMATHDVKTRVITTKLHFPIMIIYLL
jgi:hypothetical protein